jgi:LPS O-antigen subunit length determinant protein (WzzB/FepE family)
MKYNKPNIKDDEIDFLIFLNLLWKQKFFILFFSLIFAALGFFYSLSSNYFLKKNKVSETTFYLRDAPAYLFTKYKYFLKLNESLAISFNNEFKSNLENLDILLEFYSQYNKNNFSNREIFYIEKVKNQKEVVKNQQYKLIHKTKDDQKEFLKDYIFFIKHETEKNLKEKIKVEIENIINLNTLKLQIAEKIFLNKPFINTNGFMTFYESNDFFLKGSEMLYIEIEYYRNLLKENDQLKLDYNPILVDPKLSLYNQNSLTKSPVYHVSFGMFLGFFLSIFIIYFKIMTKNN